MSQGVHKYGRVDFTLYGAFIFLDSVGAMKMYKYIFLILPILLSVSPAYSWEVDVVRGYGNSDGTYPRTLATSIQLRCAFTLPDYESCVTNIITDETQWQNNYVNQRQGDAYIYALRYGQFNTSSETRFVFVIFRLLSTQDPVNFEFPTTYVNDTPLYGVIRDDELCQSLGAAGVYDGLSFIPDANGNVSFRGCLLQSTGVAVELADGTIFGNWSSSGSNGERFYPDADLEEGDSSVPEYMTPDTDCQVSCVTIDGVTYTVDQDAIINGSVLPYGGYFGGTGNGTDQSGDGDGSGGDGDDGGNGDGSGDSGGDGSGTGSGDVDLGTVEGLLGDIRDWIQDTPSEPEPDLPAPESLTRVIDIEDHAVSWSSGLAATGTCPAPHTINLPSPLSTSFEISYQPFCDLASLIRFLVLMGAYASAAFLTFRGLIHG